jgi:nitrate/nitrite-specific signal transduction histidine kinase
MQERLTQLGGSCRISNPPGGGTEVAFHLPLRSAPRNGR